MALANVTYVGVAGTQIYTIPFPFLAQAHVKLKVNGVQKTITTDYTINGAGTQLTIINPTIVNGDQIYINRETPKTAADRLVDWASGSVVTESNMDTADLQLLYIVQEAFDGADTALPLATDGSGVWDAEGLKIKNLGAPTLAADAVRKQDLDAAVISSGNLPSVSGADNDSGLAVTGGAWAVRTPSQMRTHLGLGDAALKTVGVANGNVPAMGASGYPAASGQLIDLSANPAITALQAADVSLDTRVDTVEALFNNVGYYRFNGSALPDNTSGTWLTDSSGTIGRYGPILMSSHNQSGLISTGGGNYFQFDVAGTYSLEFHILWSNSDPTDQANPRWAVTNDTGTVVHLNDGPGVTLDVNAKMTIQGAIVLTVTAGQRVALRMRNNAAVGVGVVIPTNQSNGSFAGGCYAVIRRLA